MLKGILFDMDGTLVDSERYYTDGTYTYMQRYGFNKDKKLVYEIIGTTMQETYKIVSRLLDNRLTEEEIEKINYDYFYIENPINYQNYLFPEVKDSLIDFKAKGLKLALCSASSYYDIKKFIKDCALDNIFDCILSTEEYREKPNPDIYLAALSKLHLNKDEAIVVEDSPLGIKAGKNAQIKTYARINEFTKHKQQEADVLINSLKEIGG